MSEHRATILWTRTTSDFTYDTYDRTHRWTFGSGGSVQASAAPEYKGSPELMNPEEALVGAISSCHMLTFLAVAAKKGFVVDRYEDEAVGTLEKNDKGKLSVTRAVLRPQVTFAGAKIPEPSQLQALHHTAHENCFIANSLMTEVVVEPRS